MKKETFEKLVELYRKDGFQDMKFIPENIKSDIQKAGTLSDKESIEGIYSENKAIREYEIPEYKVSEKILYVD